MRGDRGTIVKVGALLAVIVVVALILFLVVIPYIFPPEDDRYKGIPTLDGYVTDNEFVLTADEYASIYDNCLYIDEQTSCEMAVLVVNEYGGPGHKRLRAAHLTKRTASDEGREGRTGC